MKVPLRTVLKINEHRIHPRSQLHRFSSTTFYKKDGTKSNYIPDFIINLKEKTIIVETKGFPDENIYEKLVACKRLYPDTRICFSIKDIHNTINSILKLSTGNK